MVIRMITKNPKNYIFSAKHTLPFGVSKKLILLFSKDAFMNKKLFDIVIKKN